MLFEVSGKNPACKFFLALLMYIGTIQNKTNKQNKKLVKNRSEHTNIGNFCTSTPITLLYKATANRAFSSSLIA